jgi:hypothetical protein
MITSIYKTETVVSNAVSTAKSELPPQGNGQQWGCGSVKGLVD